MRNAGWFDSFYNIYIQYLLPEPNAKKVYIQVWDKTTQSYKTQDKYKGREIKKDDFASVLASYLNDGERLLVYHIPILLQKVYALARIVNRLKGYRFYGCSLLLIYDGDEDVQKTYRASVLEHPSSRSKRGESLERKATAPDATDAEPTERDAAPPPLRRSHSDDLLVGPVAKRSSARRKRGEVNIRIVDFAHTTTGRDWEPYPANGLEPGAEQVHSSGGYAAALDPATGHIFARFPPHYPDEPDRGFLFGLKNFAAALEKIYNDERKRRVKVAREEPAGARPPLPSLPKDGREIFDQIFGSVENYEDVAYLST
jgi:inositol-hexakisphosphate 5-kinase